MAAANFVVKTRNNGEGCALTGTADIDQYSVPRSFFPRVAIGCRLSLKIDRNLEGSLIGGYMIMIRHLDEYLYRSVDKPHISMPQCHAEVGTRLVR